MADGTAQRLKVVHLTTTDMSLDWLLGPQLRAFQEAGYEVVGMSAAGSHVPALEAAGTRHVPITALTRRPGLVADVRAVVQLFVQLRRERPHILHTHNPKPGVLGRVVGRLARVPVVVNTQHGLYAQPTDRRRRRWPVYVAERFAAAFSHAELVQNPEDAHTLVRRLRVPAGKVKVLGNGIDLAHFITDVNHRAELRAEWGITDDEVVVGTVGRLVREKGFHELFDAHRDPRMTTARVRLVVVGPYEPDKADEIDADSIARATHDGVVFAGQRTDMPACYAAMDLFVTATHREGFPRAAMEATACGLPVIATDIRGCRQVVDHGVTGLLVPVRDSASLATAIAELAADAHLRRQMSEAATQKALRDFDQRTVIELTLETYERLLTARGYKVAPRN